MFKGNMQYFIKSICLTLLVFHCFPAEDLCIWWNVMSFIISLISYTTLSHRFTSVWYQSTRFRQEHHALGKKNLFFRHFLGKKRKLLLSFSFFCIKKYKKNKKMASESQTANMDTNSKILQRLDKILSYITKLNQVFKSTSYHPAI